ncbi:MAG: C13 family peptidase [Dokdonella sp.]|uniref:C13 family peptidase n=1 Tax=Dokdonella sp. TaxID=2291710 RepID=UPI003BAF8F8A
MGPIIGVIRDGVRVTFLQRPRGNPVLPAADAFVASLVLYLLVELLLGWIQSEPPRMLVGWGFATLLADSSLTLLAAWLLARLAVRPAITWAVGAIALAATAATKLLIQWPLHVAAIWLHTSGNAGAALALIWLSQLWWLLVMVALARWLLPARLTMSLLAAALAFAISALPWQWIPAASPIMQDQSAAARVSAASEADSIAGAGFEAAAEEPGIEFDFDPEQLMFDQPKLLGAAIDALQPRTPGKANLYVIAFAGDGSENVFRNEVEYAAQLFAQRFNARGHVLVLANNPASIETRPLATLTNLRIALAEIAVQMDPAEDILLLYLTSHGSADHQLHVALDPLPLNQIMPADLAEALQTTPSVRWKVIVVNACYSGGFIDALRDDSTLVITAARSDRTSFGCGADSEITWFGKAFLADALNETTSFPDAFKRASALVGEWEAHEKEAQNSEPQITSSRSIEGKLEKWRRTLPASEPLPFSPTVTAKP